MPLRMAKEFIGKLEELRRALPNSNLARLQVLKQKIGVSRVTLEVHVPTTRTSNEDHALTSAILNNLAEHLSENKNSVRGRLEKIETGRIAKYHYVFEKYVQNQFIKK